MNNNGKVQQLLPREVIEFCPDIFEGVVYEVLPFHYIKSIIITLTNNTKIILYRKQYNDIELFYLDFQTLTEYQLNIKDIYFQLNVSKIKKDVIKLTNDLLKGIKK